jgi:hypothetical protein
LKLKFAPHYKSTPVEFPLEPLLIRLTEDVGPLPAGFTYELPAFESRRLIARRKAVAVGRLGTIPDVKLTEDECREAGLGEG